MATSASTRPLRRDAARNRRLLVESARATFRDEGLDAGVDGIARRAGVNVATLYRHFATKDALILAVLDELLHALEEAARDAAQHAGEGLDRFLRAAVDIQRGHRGFLEALVVHPLGEHALAGVRPRLLTALEPLVAPARAAGALRADVDARDLLVVLQMLGAAGRSPIARDPVHYLDLLRHGLRRSTP
jgi:AcrR family transcriptional regulator